ncbi:putative cardiolipin synthase YwiE [Aquicella siphonis]|uniref:Putative cardiolipin synthase YwiE n=1 Tax=Aquicella siphonis TaxID=254247 RepID=A0A5E4PKR6_9COXI|nr:phospholipase D-like domain-containing protein [Aquicella siphonis]VVC77135.1 putative cardiolipin synthase YwiE [Aquicella siphonis]
MHEYQEDILIDDEYLRSFLLDIDNAESTIDIEVYIFENDSVGDQVANVLCRAASKGVKIRILVDGVGSISWGGKIANQLETAGIRVKVYHPLPWKFSHWRLVNIKSNFLFSKILYLITKINSRNHRKVCIIDKKIVYVGSANLNDHLLRNPVTNTIWREMNVRLIGVNIDELQAAFNKAWGYPMNKIRKRDMPDKMNIESRFILNDSWRRRHQYYQMLLDRISKCRERIWVTNAYFVPDSHLLKHLIKASQRGVDVRILLPEKSDVFIVPLASATFYSILLNHGVKIYEYIPDVLHAKVLILDNWYSIGSGNLNYRSMKHDLEVNVTIQGIEAKAIIDKQFLSDLMQSHQLNEMDVQRQPLYRKLAGYLMLLIRYWI